MWFNFKHAKDLPEMRSDKEPGRVVACNDRTHPFAQHTLALADAVVDIATRPYQFYCAPCAKERGFLEAACVR